MTEIKTMVGALIVTAVVVISTKLLVTKVFLRSRLPDSSGGGIVPIIPETSSSSSSSSSSTSSSKYDVFLSFRGEDTRKTFVDHLYSALEKRVRTYKDDETLDRGDTIGPSLLNAIEASQIALIVFSENYADSSWCLDELSHIMKCKQERRQMVMPIFYDVDPSDVRKQKGQFGKAFAKHKLSKNISKIETWIKALVDASNIAGWETKHVANGHEAKCIREIVDSILDKLPSLSDSAAVEANKELVGMGTRLKDLKRVLRIGSGGVRMVGIWGIGGGGKTTLANSLYKELRISGQFHGCCFLENIREESKQHNGLKSLQGKILTAVFDKKLEVESVDIGKDNIKDILCRRNVLIVLDDVDHLDQLEALAGQHDWFGDGSRIIITTRNKQVLISHRVDEIYPISLLSLDEAIQLFRRHAYNEKKPVQDYEKFSLRVISYVNGLPLALKILGCFLRSKDKNEWMSALDKLKHIPNSKVTDQLRISYDGLDRNENELFLDIACFYRCNYEDGAMEILDACPAIGVDAPAGRGCISSFTPPVRQTDLLEAEAMQTLVLLNTVTYPTDPVHDIIYRSFDREYDITHHVFRWDTTPYEQVFANGFHARRQENVSDEVYCNLEQYVNRGGRPLDSTRPAPHCFVSTTLDSGWYPSVRTEQGVLEVTRYEIYAPGGIWVAETLGDRYPFRAQDEVAFVNGIAPQYIRSAQLFRLQASGRHTRRERVNNIIHINGGFDPQLFYADERMPEIRSPIQLYENPTTKRKENLIVPPRETNIEYVNYKAFVDDGILINAAFRSRQKYQVYVFMKNEYAVIDYAPGSSNDRVVHGPHLICGTFPSLRGTAFGEHGIDCAFATHYHNECFIFSGNLCAKIDYAPGTNNDKILKGPVSIFKMFSFLKETVFETGVDAAFESSTKDEAYLFKGNQYALINYSDNKPKLFHIEDISEGFPSLKGTIFDKGIDAAFASHLSGVAYIFKGDTYTRINFAHASTNDRIVYGPAKIINNWPSLKSILPRPTTKRKGNLIVPPHMRRKRETNIEYVNYKAFVDNGIFINAAFRSSRKYQVYVFMKNEYAVIDYAPGSGNDRVVNGPHLICGTFPSLSGTVFGEHGIDCAFATHYRNECFIFSRNLCAKIDYAPGTNNDKILKGPMSIFKMFSFLKETIFENGVDAAFESSTEDEAYLFKGNQYALINYSDNKPKVFHIKDISEGFPSLKGTIFDKGIDAAFTSHLSDEAYIYKGDTYTRINFSPASTNDHIVYGPAKIIDNWPSLKSILPRPNDGLDVHDHAIEAPDRDHDEV